MSSRASSFASPTPPRSPTAASAADTHLDGRGLLIARVGWIVLTLLVLTLSAIAIPGAAALVQSVCQPGAPCLSGQLTPADLRLLQQLDLSPGFLAAYGGAWDVGTVLVYSALATLIFWRRSADRMALFCAYMLVLTGGATYTKLLDAGLRPLAPAWYWPVGVLELLGLVSLLTFFLLFPSGRFVPRWTRWGVLVAVVLEAQYVFLTDQVQTSKDGPANFLIFAALILSLVGLQVYRYRRVSTLRERQQTKWVVFGFSMAVVGFVLTTVLGHVLLPEQTVQSAVFQILVSDTLSYGFLLLIPVSIAIAILRTRLWDVDLLINRTLVYGSLTGALLLIYFGSVVVLEQLVRSLSGQTHSDLVVVASTLAIAAIFNPLRKRIQSFIDRRFYRRKYDAAATLAAFSATMRDEVDLATLASRLVEVVEETMQPVRTSLWLRPPDKGVK